MMPPGWGTCRPPTQGSEHQVASHDFVVSVGKDVVAACPVPLLVLPGIDEYHPTAAGREIAALAPRAEMLEPWKDSPEHVADATEAIRCFLLSHTDPVGPPR